MVAAVAVGVMTATHWSYVSHYRTCIVMTIYIFRLEETRRSLCATVITVNCRELRRETNPTLMTSSLERYRFQTREDHLPKLPGKIILKGGSPNLSSVKGPNISEISAWVRATSACLLARCSRNGLLYPGLHSKSMQ